MLDAYDDRKNKGVRKQLRSLFLQDEVMPSVQLQKFLSTEEFSFLVKELSNVKLKMVNVVAEKSLRVGVLPRVCEKMFANEDVRSLVESVVGRKVSLESVRVEVFSWRDYTLQEVEPPRIESIFSINSWKSIVPSRGGGVFAVDGSGSFKELSAHQNTLTILDRKKTVRLFHKYVNHRAGDESLWFVVAKWK